MFRATPISPAKPHLTDTAIDPGCSSPQKLLRGGLQYEWTDVWLHMDRYSGLTGYSNKVCASQCHAFWAVCSSTKVRSDDCHRQQRSTHAPARQGYGQVRAWGRRDACLNHSRAPSDPTGRSLCIAWQQPAVPSLEVQLIHLQAPVPRSNVLTGNQICAAVCHCQA